jgi:dolichyl-phosphate-mannose--protein O-mannosyl transferase
MKLLTIVLTVLMIFFYLLFLPFAFLLSCFKLVVQDTDRTVSGIDDTLCSYIEKRKK